MTAADAQRPVVMWFRQDLRLADNPALTAAIASGRPVIPLFVLHQASDGRDWGAASLWWLDKSLRALDESLRARGSRLILRRGDPAVIVPALVQEVQAAEIGWNRLYGQAAVERDSQLKADFGRAGVKATSYNGSLLAEPWTVKTGSGGFYQTFTPFWRAAEATLGPVKLDPAPRHIPAPHVWPASDPIDDWRLHPRQPDWSTGFGDWRPGEAGAQARLETFVDHLLADYPDARDRPEPGGASRLSPHLHWGEIGPRQVRAAIATATSHNKTIAAAAGKFMAEIGWREFNHHLLYHHGALYARNIRPAFDAFPWREDASGLAIWREGRTGYPLVDAGMRELWTTGFMHNRVRMVVASFLIKHLLLDWRHGEAWFWDTLVDADAANNPANWQWSAGSGADAAPFFRVFNPIAQSERFDPQGAYIRRWVPELAGLGDAEIHKPWEADAPGYPKPIVEHAMARQRALDAFKDMRGEES
jgi:deoxyribodipyrimidine photo-lyase